jgi:hypothetical protein
VADVGALQLSEGIGGPDRLLAGNGRCVRLDQIPLHDASLAVAVAAIKAGNPYICG